MPFPFTPEYSSIYIIRALRHKIVDYVEPNLPPSETSPIIYFIAFSIFSAKYDLSISNQFINARLLVSSISDFPLELVIDVLAPSIPPDVVF